MKKWGLSPQEKLGTVPIFPSSTIYIGSLYEENTDGTTQCHIYLGQNKAFTQTYHQSPTSYDLHFYHSDHLGSSNIVTDSTGTLAQLLEKYT